MATSSQYYRSANNHAHYQEYNTNTHDHLYNFWQQDSNHLPPYNGPPPAPILHNSQGGPASVAPSNSTTQDWSSGYPRHNIQAWSQSVDSGSYAARSESSYDVAEGPTSALHHPPESRRHDYHQEPPSNRHELPLNPAVNAYRESDRFTEVRSTKSPANSVGPAFTTHVQSAQTLPRLPHIQSRATSVHLDAAQRPIYPLPNSNWNVESDRHPRYSVDASSSLVQVPEVPDHAGPSRQIWQLDDAGVVAGAAVPPAYERSNEVEQHWPHAQIQPEHGAYSQQHAQFDESPDTFAQSQDDRRFVSRKKAARVPSSFVERQEKLKVSKRKGPLQEKQREKTHTMRKTKRICVRCRFYKSGCDEGDPCEKCQKITGHARSFREPCYREHLEDTSLVRRCNGREHQEEAEFLGYDWIVNSQLFEMEIIWNLPGYGRIPSAPPIRVTFRPYSPRRGSLDVATSVWSNKEGQVKAVEQPAYAIYDTASLLPAYERYFANLQPAIEDWIFSRVRQDEIATLTYAEVRRMRVSTKGSEALDYAMRIQCLSVVSQGYGSVWSNNIPGIREYDYRRFGSSDYEAYDRKSYDRPLPGAITHQMDVAAVKCLKKLEKEFVKKLAALIFQPKIKPWYELFLAMYVIFWNLEYIHHGANDYMKSKNGTVIENQVSSIVNTQIRKWEFAFPVLLYHWRCTLRGYSPFKLARENPQELREKGHLDDMGYQYVSKIAEIFQRADTDRFQPPLTGFATQHYSTSSEWIVKLFKEAGA